MAYRSEVFVFDEGRPVRAVVRNYTKDDFADMIRIQSECFPPPFPSDLWWNEEQLTNHITLFPEGTLCVEVDGRLVGSLTGLCVQFDPAHPSHRWEAMTDNGYIRNHDPKGNTLYIVDIAVSPKYRKWGLGKLLMQAMYQIVIELKLERLLGGGRMPGYHLHAFEMTADDYVQAVISGEFKDPVITFLLRCGRTPVAVVENYLEDEESLNYGFLMEWKNPFH
ncbi:GNAT family N-acetyltransferase [Sporosarcina sp. ACRSM]|uniref:GNAT family N-acetyltransferase n=1 Tax=Sporosarcina sp. ACRSM TaxID=2918216 RepID=UPI001EF4EF79|nr:GNAT family N-acetyltransferase [Sporosarcina sp. ACRSM]MCG7336895.1 GNAT family N-acetyltransferase [Sporosarcina sp. ACRSM]